MPHCSAAKRRQNGKLRIGSKTFRLNELKELR
jgi:hypothetical protein